MYNNRIYDILDFTEKEQVVDFYVKDTDLHVVYLDEEENTSHYITNMSERPEALDYVLGLRNEYNDWHYLWSLGIGLW